MGLRPARRRSGRRLCQRRARLLGDRPPWPASGSGARWRPSASASRTRASTNRPEQRTVVDWLGTRHHDILCGAAAIRDTLDEVVWHCETPLLRTSPVPLFLLSKLVREAGMRTVLTGEGRRRTSGRLHHLQGGPDPPLLGPAAGIPYQAGAAQPHPPLCRQRAGALDWPVAELLPPRPRSRRPPLLLAPDPLEEHRVVDALPLAPPVREAFDFDEMLAEAEQAAPPGWRDWDPLLKASWTEIDSFMSTYLLSLPGRPRRHGPTGWGRRATRSSTPRWSISAWRCPSASR